MLAVCVCVMGGGDWFLWTMDGEKKLVHPSDNRDNGEMESLNSQMVTILHLLGHFLISLFMQDLGPEAEPMSPSH